MAREGKPPAFQFYAADWLADEEVTLMELDEEGALARLMAYQWREGSIPADRDQLHKLLKKPTTGQFARIWRAVGDRFAPHPSEPGRLIHPRLHEQRIELDAYREVQAKKGRASAAKRAASTGGEPDGNGGGNNGQGPAPTEGQPNSNNGSTAVATAVEFRYQPNGNSASASASARSQNPLPLTGFGDDLSCTYCGVLQSQVTWAFEMDHFVPKAAGGTDDPANLLTCCHVCNQIKQGRIFPTVNEAREFIHRTLWTKRRKRYEEPRKLCFGGKPPAGSDQPGAPGLPGYTLTDAMSALGAGGGIVVDPFPRELAPRLHEVIAATAPTVDDLRRVSEWLASGGDGYNSGYRGQPATLGALAKGSTLAGWIGCARKWPGGPVGRTNGGGHSLVGNTTHADDGRPSAAQVLAGIRGAQ